MTVSIEPTVKERMTELTGCCNLRGLETKVAKDELRCVIEASCFAQKPGSGIFAYQATIVTRDSDAEPVVSLFETHVMSVEDVLALPFGSMKKLAPFTLPLRAELEATAESTLSIASLAYLDAKIRAAVGPFLEKNSTGECYLSWDAWEESDSYLFTLDPPEGADVFSLTSLLRDLPLINGCYDCTLELKASEDAVQKVQFTRTKDGEGIPHLATKTTEPQD